MIAVIFEVEPHSTHKQEYLDIAASLKPELEQLEGFISVERFQSLVNKDKLLSLSFFEDEDAIARWRGSENHREAQTSGRNSIFKHYRIRIAGVIRDYGMQERQQAPDDSRHAHTL